MKRFDIITEADARVLAPGETVALATGGQITPLARDTLRERRVVVVMEGTASQDEAALAPTADVRTVALGSDHSGVALRKALARFLRGRGLAVHDLGADGPEQVAIAVVAELLAVKSSRQPWPLREKEGTIHAG